MLSGLPASAGPVVGFDGVIVPERAEFGRPTLVTTAPALALLITAEADVGLGRGAETWVVAWVVTVGTSARRVCTLVAGIEAFPTDVFFRSEVCVLVRVAEGSDITELLDTTAVLDTAAATVAGAGAVDRLPAGR